MLEKTIAGLQNSGTETRLQQVPSHLHRQSLDDPICQLCGDPLREGDQIPFFLYKPIGRARYRISQCRCRTHDDNLPGIFTLGIEELLVDSQVGKCRDHATQRAWPIPLNRCIRLISTSDTTTGFSPANTNQPDTTAGNHGKHLYEQADTNQPTPHQSPAYQTEIQIRGRQ